MSDDEKKAIFLTRLKKLGREEERKKFKMTKNELYDIINEEIRDFKYGVNHFLVTEELNESDRDEIRKIIRQEVSTIFFDLFKKRKLGESQ